MYEDLTPRQIDILTYIKRQIKYNGYPPAIREVCEGLNINSTSTVHSNIKKLEDVLGYGYNDKRSDKIWNHLQEIEQFNDDVFPDKLKKFISNE